MIRVSVVVPVFNAQGFLPETLSCLQQQTLTSIEVLCVDDGSTDASASIIQATTARDPRIRYLSKANGGVGSARNLGLSQAVGDYVCFIDADDLIGVEHLEALYDSTAPERPDILVTGNVVELWPDGSTSPRKVGVFEETLLTSPAEKAPLITTTGLTQNKLYRRSFLENNGLRHYSGKSVSEDNYFTICSTILAHTIKTVFRGSYQYRQHPTSITKVRKNAGDASMFEVYDQAREFISGALGDTALRDTWEPIILERERIDLVNFHNELAPPDRAAFRAMTETLSHNTIRIDRPPDETTRIIKYHLKGMLARLGLCRPS